MTSLSEIQRLIEKWRELADYKLKHYTDEESVRANRSYNNALQTCADELEAVLRSALGAAPEKAPLQKALEAIRDYEPRPEICYDQFAYEWIVEAYRDAAKKALAALSAAPAARQEEPIGLSENVIVMPKET